MVVWPGSGFPFSLHLPQFWFLERFPQLALVLRLQYVTMFYPLPLLPTQFLVGVSASPAGMEERWALGGQEQEPREGALGGGSRDGLSPGPALVSLGRHQAWVRSRFGGVRSHSVPSPGDLGDMCLSYWLQVSEEVGCGPAGIKASSFLLLLALRCLRAGMSAGWEFSQQGFFPVRATDSSWSLGTAPHGQGLPQRARVRAGAPQRLPCWGLGLIPILHGKCKHLSLLWVRRNLGFWSCGAQEKQWEALGTRNSPSVRRERGWPYPTSLTSSSR